METEETYWKHQPKVKKTPSALKGVWRATPRLRRVLEREH